MDRELVWAVLALLLCGAAVSVAGWCPPAAMAGATAAALERRAWRRLWLPFVPALLVFAALCGWAAVEPAASERVPPSLFAGVLPFVIIVVRAAWRALRSARASAGAVPIGTLGLIRPRIVISPQAADRLDAAARAAALEHERAHARHRDPLRLWLAQLASDLLWPWPLAGVRLRQWRQALELARDEEARRHGAAGADLAAAVLAAVRSGWSTGATAAAMLEGEAAAVQHRIACLLAPLQPAASAPRGTMLWLAGLSGVGLAVALGTAFGERIVPLLLQVL